MSNDEERIARLEPEHIKSFMFAGNARFTLVGSEKRYTFRVSEAPNNNGFFVGVLNSTDNESGFVYIGFISRNKEFRHTKKSPSKNDVRFKAFEWFYIRLMLDKSLEPLEFWHEGRCGRCGRALTVPESIYNGLGPICAGKV